MITFHRVNRDKKLLLYQELLLHYCTQQIQEMYSDKKAVFYEFASQKRLKHPVHTVDTEVVILDN